MITMEKLTSKQIGNLGECYIHSLLPSSIMVNKEKEMGLPYDLIWKDKKIDVKSTMKQHASGLVFSDSMYMRVGVVFVYVALAYQPPLLWVFKSRRGFGHYVKIKDACPLENFCAIISTI